MSKKFPLKSKNFNPFCELIGLDFTEAENGSSSCYLEMTKELLNPNRVMHGGVLYSMADTGMGGAIYTLLNDDENCATLEIKISYLKAVSSGLLTCDTKVIHRGKTSAILESEIKNDDILVAKASGTFSIFKNRR